MAAMIPPLLGNVSDMNICPVMWRLSFKTLYSLGNVLTIGINLDFSSTRMMTFSLP
ncbi:hypothetical protein BDV41DRAFT_548449 [Aspergillus transmontanensis]|uniref:Uncharacterized protein n=1 Tax=Aspergillus transmontanensis TaxID=1034304 RepID=A0A5N6VME4_9EURO|nr:hypothetical protein BDV41DRAFT_548449 [Aspergillus transmontanensis]